MKSLEPTARRTRYDGVLAALAFAGSVALLVGHWLPVRFTYRENDLGIVSIATLQRYPVQQETFWYLFTALLVVFLTWAFALAANSPTATIEQITFFMSQSPKDFRPH